MTLDEFVGRLSGLKTESGGGFVALCPAHDDTEPSLRVTLGEKGGIIVKCRAGCGTLDVLKRLGLAFRDLMPDLPAFRAPAPAAAGPCPEPAGGAVAEEAWGPWAEVPDGRFAYVSESGVALWKVREERANAAGKRKKRFQWYRGTVSKETYGLGGEIPKLYRSGDVDRAKAEGLALAIAEGERKADRLGAIGIQATCPENGASSWKPAHAEQLRGIKRVVVFPDNDKPGRELLQKIAATVRAVGGDVFEAQLHGLPEGGDILDFLAAGGTGAEIRVAFETAGPARAPEPEPERERAIAGPVGLDGFGFTEFANGERLAAKHGPGIRYCHPWRKWLVWDEKRWKEDDTAAIDRLAKETVRSLWDQLGQIPSEKAREAFFRFIAGSERAGKLESMKTLAASEKGIPVLPRALDADPWKLNCLNGTLDLKTKALAPHRKEDMNTKLAPVNWNPEAKAPRWESFIWEVTGSREGLFGFLRRIVGMSLTGVVKDHALFLLYGTGRNGKSTFLNALQQVLGEDYSTQASPDFLLDKGNMESHPTELTNLHKKRVVVVNEPSASRRLAESLVKSLTGGDKIRARRMREDSWQFDPTHKIFLAANHKPRVKDQSRGLWSRIKLIPFTESFEGREDHELPEKLASEIEGILRWAVEGCLEWQRNGLQEPPEVAEAVEEYRRESDSLGTFLEERCDSSEEARVPSSELYRSYADWSDENKTRAFAREDFYIFLEERGYPRTRVSAGDRKGHWDVVGLRLKSVVSF